MRIKEALPEESDNSEEFEFYVYCHEQAELELMNDPAYPEWVEYTESQHV